MTDPIDILARTICGENRGGGAKGMTSVACVILNRAANPRWWGNDITSVCLAREQFSCWNEGDPNRAFIQNLTSQDQSFLVALGIADDAVNGRLADITNGADSYYAAGSPVPSWAAGQTPTAEIAGQLFFRIELR